MIDSPPLRLKLYQGLNVSEELSHFQEAMFQHFMSSGDCSVVRILWGLVAAGRGVNFGFLQFNTYCCLMGPVCHCEHLARVEGMLWFQWFVTLYCPCSLYTLLGVIMFVKQILARKSVTGMLYEKSIL